MAAHLVALRSNRHHRERLVAELARWLYCQCWVEIERLANRGLARIRPVQRQQVGADSEPQAADRLAAWEAERPVVANSDPS